MSEKKFEGSFETVPNLDYRFFRSGTNGDLRWDWKVTSGLAFNNSTQKLENAVFLSWKFDWSELKKVSNVGGFEGTITAKWKPSHSTPSVHVFAAHHQTLKFSVQLDRCREWIHKKITAVEDASKNKKYDFAFDFELKQVERTKEMQIFESIFAESELNDVTLIVEGHKKMHVNKALLSYHSEYFRAIFSSDFQEKSTKEIRIENVKYEDFASLLCLVINPVPPTANNIAKTLELSDRFQMHFVPKMADLMIRKMEDVQFGTILMLASTYKMEQTEQECLEMLTSIEHIKLIGKMGEFEKLTDSTKLQFLKRCMNLL